MTSSTVASFLQHCSALSLNNALKVNLFSNNPFPRQYSLDVVSHPNTACMNRMLLQMSAPNSLWVTLISQMRFFLVAPPPPPLCRTLHGQVEANSTQNISVPYLVRCLGGLNVHFCKKSPKWAQLTFDRYLSNPDIGCTFLGWVNPF